MSNVLERSVPEGSVSVIYEVANNVELCSYAVQDDGMIASCLISISRPNDLIRKAAPLSIEDVTCTLQCDM